MPHKISSGSFFLNLILVLLTLILCCGSAPSYGQQTIEQEVNQYMASAPFKMGAINQPQIPSHKVDIIDFGAVGDGHVLNTEAINTAIAACAKEGGGRVNVPAGLWLTGPIRMLSNINLHLAKGAIVLFSPDHQLYPFVRTDSSSNSWFLLSPIYGYKLHDIAITGEGILNGSGDSWRPLKKSKTTASQWNDLMHLGGVVSDDGAMWWPTREAMNGESYLKKLQKTTGHKLTGENLEPARDFLRPYMVSLISCKKVLINGPTIMNSPKFALYPKNCTDLIIRDVKINNEWYAQNGDGIDLANCKNAIVYKCTVNAGDDGICMKSSRASSDTSNDPSLSNILIADCIVYHAHGGFVIGSNTDGGIRNVSVQNCNFINTDVGIRIKSGRGRGGLVHQVYLKNIFMTNIAQEAILFDSYYEEKSKSTKTFAITRTTPDFQYFYLDSIYCDGAKMGISLTGLPERAVQFLFLSNINITANKSYQAVDTSFISMQNVKINDHVYNQ